MFWCRNWPHSLSTFTSTGLTIVQKRVCTFWVKYLTSCWICKWKWSIGKDIPIYKHALQQHLQQQTYGGLSQGKTSSVAYQCYLHYLPWKRRKYNNPKRDRNIVKKTEWMWGFILGVQCITSYYRFLFEKDIPKYHHSIKRNGKKKISKQIYG